MNPAAYPLAWPDGWPRTQARERGAYRTPLPTALRNLEKQLALLCGTRAASTLVLSSNCTLGQSNPKDPGVVAYFTWDNDAMAIPCDRWASVEANVQAIALTIEAMRAMERHGAKHMIKAMFRGFTALPAPDSAQDWCRVFGFPSRHDITLAHAEAAYRALARDAHPDRPGGSHEAMARLNRAIDAARRELAP